MRSTLIPKEQLKFFLVSKKMAVFFGVIGSLLLIISSIYVTIFTSFDLNVFLTFFFIIMGITAILLLPRLMHQRVICSDVIFTDKKIQVVDSKAVCWREVSYSSITSIRTEELYGWFFGSNPDKDRVKIKYICLFMNNQSEIPFVPYSRLFHQDDFFLIAYTDEVYEFIIKNTCLKFNN